MEVQTRSEANGIKLFSTLKKALEAAEEDTSIWKISFWTEVPSERVRLVRSADNEWVLDQMEKYLPEPLSE